MIGNIKKTIQESAKSIKNTQESAISTEIDKNERQKASSSDEPEKDRQHKTSQAEQGSTGLAKPKNNRQHVKQPISPQFKSLSPAHLPA